MATIHCQGKTFSSINTILFDKDGTIAQVEDYLKKLGYARSHFIAVSTKATLVPRTKEAKGTTSVSKELLPTLDLPSALESAILRTFGLSSNRLDPAGLLAVGSRYDNEIAAAACLAASGCGWIKAIQIAQSAFIQAADTLSPKVMHTPLLPNVHTGLKRIKAAGINIGIVSSDLHSEVTAFIAHHQLTEVTWHCGFSSDYLPKTHPDFLQFACDEMSTKANETLIIGDSDADYELSRQGAAGFLGMVGGWSQPPDMPPDIARFSDWQQIDVF